MRHGLDAAIAVMLIALVGAVAANPITLKTYAQAVELAKREQSAISSSEFALSHCPPQGIAVCANGVVRVNEVVALPPLSNAKGFCVKRLVLLNGNIRVAVFCQ